MMDDDFEDMSDLDRRNRPVFRLIALVLIVGLLPLFAIYVVWQVLA
jgi:hypothetical protein